MAYYRKLSYYGMNDFIICCGYKGYFIKEYLQVSLSQFNVEVDLKRYNQGVINY